MVVMDHVHGDSFYGMHREPTDAELRDVARQASLINAMDYHPRLLFDSWAIPNFVKLYELVEEFIPPEDRPLIDLALARYEEITVEQLPHAFVHGDFTKLNLMTDQRGDVYVLDFSVSNWYPRIQEQAVIAANLLDSNKYPTSLTERCQRIGDAYSRFTPLTDLERRCLYPYALAGVGMEYLGSLKERHISGNDSAETAQWFQLGRDGLRTELLGSRGTPDAMDVGVSP
jgi:Ser/Thr protein kinase RdoA (MazF antagonist)